jgi:protein involved in polysaccharide export with SLBB domain
MEALDDKHRLGVGDRLSIRIVEDREEAREVVVTDSGELDIPYVGRVMAKGKTCKEVALEAKALLEQEYYHKATVILAIDLFSRTRGRVYVVGQVRITGAIEIPSNETFTLSKAILIAGGFTDFADKKKVRLTRRSAKDVSASPSQTVDVQEILEQGRTEKDPELEPDDLVFVPARWLNL